MNNEWEEIIREYKDTVSSCYSMSGPSLSLDLRNFKLVIRLSSDEQSFLKSPKVVDLSMKNQVWPF